MCIEECIEECIEQRIEECIEVCNVLTDCVGTAMDSLGANQVFLSNRPSSFKSLEHAIEWRYIYKCVYECEFEFE